VFILIIVNEVGEIRAAFARLTSTSFGLQLHLTIIAELQFD
jgi:hypothetical protein